MAMIKTLLKVGQEDHLLGVVLTCEALILVGQTILPAIWTPSMFIQLFVIALAFTCMKGFILYGFALRQEKFGILYVLGAAIFLWFAVSVMHGFWKFNFGPLSYAPAYRAKGGYFATGDSAIATWGIVLMLIAVPTRILGIAWYLKRGSNTYGERQFISPGAGVLIFILMVIAVPVLYLLGQGKIFYGWSFSI